MGETTDQQVQDFFHQQYPLPNSAVFESMIATFSQGWEMLVSWRVWSQFFCSQPKITISWFWCFGFAKATGCVTMFVEVICSNALLNAFAQSSEWFKALIHLQYMRSTGETTVTWLLSLSWCFFFGMSYGVRGFNPYVTWFCSNAWKQCWKHRRKSWLNIARRPPPKKKILATEENLMRTQPSRQVGCTALLGEKVGRQFFLGGWYHLQNITSTSTRLSTKKAPLLVPWIHSRSMSFSHFVPSKNHPQNRQNDSCLAWPNRCFSRRPLFYRLRSSVLTRFSMLYGIYGSEASFCFQKWRSPDFWRQPRHAWGIG